ncbi:PTS sugar transporter subunit IIB [Microbacterium sp. NPDC058342]|uniref:PTS sugar transporter subunit IIB n=1 Tax=Microbacterium sp. NPDC058342 TaxID=3346454 RepID=UPI00365D7AD0
MRILVVCGAGASSTFVAQRLARAAAAAGLPWTTEAGTEQSARAAAGVDVVLVGPHLADRVDGIRSALPEHVLVAALSHDAFADFDGTRTLRFVRDAMAAPHDRKEIP